jgi:hypothetical protein
MLDITRSRLRTRWTTSSLQLVTAAALAIDAFVHADLVTRYDPNQGSAAISQGGLFRIEAALSAFTALALIVSGRRIVWALAVAVAASALGGLLLYRYADPGALGPLPDMYEPLWYPEKTLTAIAEAVATVTAVVGFLIAPDRSAARAGGVPGGVDDPADKPTGPTD